MAFIFSFPCDKADFYDDSLLNFNILFYSSYRHKNFPENNETLPKEMKTTKRGREAANAYFSIN